MVDYSLQRGQAGFACSCTLVGPGFSDISQRISLPVVQGSVAHRSQVPIKLYFSTFKYKYRSSELADILIFAFVFSQACLKMSNSSQDTRTTQREYVRKGVSCFFKNTGPVTEEPTITLLWNF